MSRRRTESDRLKSAAEKLTLVVSQVREYALVDHAAFLEGHSFELSIKFLKVNMSTYDLLRPFVLKQGHKKIGKLAYEARKLLFDIAFKFVQCAGSFDVFMDIAKPDLNSRGWPALDHETSKKMSSALHKTFQDIPESSLTRLTQIAAEMLECDVVPEKRERSAVSEKTDDESERWRVSNAAKFMEKHLEFTRDFKYCKSIISKACSQYQEDAKAGVPLGKRKGIKSFGKGPKRRLDIDNSKAWILGRESNLMGPGLTDQLWGRAVQSKPAPNEPKM